MKICLAVISTPVASRRVGVGVYLVNCGSIDILNGLWLGGSFDFRFSFMFMQCSPLLLPPPSTFRSVLKRLERRKLTERVALVFSPFRGDGVLL